MTEPSAQTASNLILTMFPADVRSALARTLEAVALPARTVLYEPNVVPQYVHFLTSGMASIVAYMKDGEAAEVGLVGREGVPESIYLLGSLSMQMNCFMQIGGSGLRMRMKDFERLYQRDERVQRCVLRFVQYQTIVLSQAAACNRLHEVEERLARWLLMAGDLVGQPNLRLTQEFLSHMLGARRSTVTQVAGSLRRKGLIECSRGEVRILERRGLEGIACECYRITSDALEALRHFSASAPLENGHNGLRAAQ